ncbi:MAG: hypothetical protein ACREBN_10935 [Burkholderiaceae bacterium]
MNSQETTSGRRIAGWAGLLAAPLGLFNLVTFMSVAGGDMTALIDPSFVFALPASSQALFTASMIADALGFYLLVAMLGSYLATRLPVEQSGRVAIALPCLLIFAILGIIGALVQMAALPALSALNAAGAVGAAPAWAAIAVAAQGGLWWFEMLPFALFALLLGPALRAAKVGFGRVLTVAGVLALIYWVLSIQGVAALPGAAMVAELCAFGALIAILTWALLTGWALLRK